MASTTAPCGQRGAPSHVAQTRLDLSGAVTELVRAQGELDDIDPGLPPSVRRAMTEALMCRVRLARRFLDVVILRHT